MRYWEYYYQETIERPGTSISSNGYCMNLQRPSLRIIALEELKHVEWMEESKVPFRVSREVYSAIVTNFNISPLFLGVVLNSDPTHFKVSCPPLEYIRNINIG